MYKIGVDLYNFSDTSFSISFLSTTIPLPHAPQHKNLIPLRSPKLAFGYPQDGQMPEITLSGFFFIPWWISSSGRRIIF
jgi:hypothetical protein